MVTQDVVQNILTLHSIGGIELQLPDVSSIRLPASRKSASYVYHGIYSGDSHNHLTVIHENRCNDVYSFFSGDPPSLPDLLQLKVPQEVGANYRIFGILLLNDDTGCRVDAIQGTSLSDIVISILQEWIAGRGRPRTWQALIETLNDCELTVLADKIQAEAD